MTAKYPVLMKPAYKEYLWGGNRLKTAWNKADAPEILAESWELASHKNGSSTAANGELQGLSLGEITSHWGDAVGTMAVGCDRFPLMLKLIDARQALSVQVHPDDTYSLKNENDFGKTECWYIVDCEPDAFIYYGLSKDITKDELVSLVKENTLTACLKSIKVKQGELYFIPPGTIHAIGKRILIAELQQNSDVTYRIFDYGRIGADGKERPLHLDKALEVSTLSPAAVPFTPPSLKTSLAEITMLCACKYFALWKLCGNHAMLNCDSASFHALTCIEGHGEIILGNSSCTFSKGDTYFLPAGLGEYELSGDFEVLLSRL